MSCETADTDISLTVINAPLSTKVVRICDIIDDIDYIYLEENKYSMISPIYSALYLEDYFVIKPFERESLLFFDHTGKYTFALHSTGKGPNEINEITAITVNRVKNQIYISDRTQLKIFLFDMNLRTVIQSFKVDWQIQAIQFFKNKIYALAFDEMNGFLKIFDSEMNLLNQEIFSPSYFNTIPGRKPFYIYQDQLYLNGSISDSMYHIKDLSAIPIAKIGSGPSSYRHMKTDEVYENLLLKSKKWLYSDRNPYFITYGHFSIHQDLMFIPTYNWKSILWNIHSTRSISIKSSNIEGFGCIGKYVNQSIFSDDETLYLYNTVYRDDFISAYNALKKNNQLCDWLSEAFQYVITTTDSTFQNPIIVKYKFKKNLMDRF